MNSVKKILNFKVIFFLLLVLSGSLTIIKTTKAYLTDTEKILGNSIQAGVWETTIAPTPTEAPSPETPTLTPTETPTPTPTPITDHIVINEVYYHGDSPTEWVELYNPTDNSISLSGWSVEDNTSCDNVLDNPIIFAKSFAILTTQTEADFRSQWSVPLGIVFIQSPTAIGNGLAENDELIIRNFACGSLDKIDYISWGTNINGLNPSIHSVGEGHSIERNPDGKDTDTAADFIDQSSPSPGS